MKTLLQLVLDGWEVEETTKMKDGMIETTFRASHRSYRDELCGIRLLTEPEARNARPDIDSLTLSRQIIYNQFKDAAETLNTTL